MDWRETYRKKLCTAGEAVSHIKSGDRVVIGHAAGEPVALLNALVENAAQYRDVELLQLVCIGEANFCKPEYRDNFRYNSLFLWGPPRKALERGQGDYTPTFFYQVPNLLRTSLHPNVTLLSLSPPDEHGYCSYGVSVDYTKPAAECSDLRIAQINRNMPRVFGDCFVHVNDMDYIVEADTPLIETPRAAISPVEEAIGRHCASLVQDGDTLQLGIGAIPDAMLLFLKDKKDLGIHSEMISDGVMELVQAGVITGRRKNLYPGKIVVNFIMGSRKFYDFIHDNPMMQMMSVDIVNDPVVVARNDNMVSINSCIQVDITGQVVSESVGRRQFSGPGGQVDFVRGANLSKNGRSIMAMPSTSGKGKISKIVPVLDEGAAVTTSRAEVNYVITEYGIASLRGKTLRQRARSLIAIAHPDFRPALQAEYELRFKESF